MNVIIKVAIAPIFLLSLGLLVQQHVCAEDASDAPEEDLLLKAIAEGDLEEVKELDALVGLRQITNLTSYALGSPNADVVAYLRDRRGLNISDLQIAAIRGNATEVNQLLDGIDKSSMEKALAKGYAPPISSYSPLSLAVRRGHTDVVRQLISAGANVNEGTHYSLTPLANAAERGHAEVVKVLLEAGANVNSRPDGYTPLMRACIGGQPSTAELLLEAGADPTKERHDGRRALHFAAMKGCPECVRLLLKHGADIDAITDTKKTALSYAQLYKHEEVVEILEAATTD